MNIVEFYALLGATLFSLGLYALIVRTHLLRKILALNVIGSSIFLILIALAKQPGSTLTDAVPHAMVITGIVVAISATALALILMIKLVSLTGHCDLSSVTGTENKNDSTHH